MEVDRSLKRSKVGGGWHQSPPSPLKAAAEHTMGGEVLVWGLAESGVGVRKRKKAIMVQRTPARSQISMEPPPREAGSSR